MLPLKHISQHKENEISYKIQYDYLKIKAIWGRKNDNSKTIKQMQ